MKTILIASDFSPYSKYAIRFAANNLSFRLQRMIILHAIYPSARPSTSMIHLDDILLEKSSRGLEADHAYALSVLPDAKVDVVTISKPKHIIESVHEVMREEEVDMIMIGMNPQPLGNSHTDNDPVIHWSSAFKKPVLAVPMA